MARFYANENFSKQVVERLRILGHDFLTVIEAGKANQKIPDETVLEFATQQQRAVLTINRQHFIRWHDLYPNHAGMVVCTQDADIDGQATRIHEAVQQFQSLQGRLIRVNRPQR